MDVLSDAAKAKVDEYLAGCAAVREGVLEMYFIENPFGTSTLITKVNVDESESTIRDHFKEVYPEIAPTHE